MAAEVAYDKSLIVRSREREFRDILESEKLHPVFQPIVDLTNKDIFGYEALIRGPRDSYFRTPRALFTTAKKLGLETELEISCRKKSIQAFAEMGLPQKLFLNISPSALLKPDFKKGRTLQYLNDFGVNLNKVVIEVTEYQKTHDYASLNNALRHYRSMGFKVALDDIGSGYSGLRLWTEVLPDYIKIDKHFIHNIHQDRIKASFVTGLIAISSASNCKIIAEGVESMEELSALLKMGLPFAQGFYFAMPREKPATRIETGLINMGTRDMSPPNAATHEYISSITRVIEPKSPDTPVKKILELFQQNQELQFLPIVDGTVSLGIIDRNQFYKLLMETQYALELYGKHPISKYVNRDIMMVDRSSDLAYVSQQITSVANTNQAFIVTAQNKYFGIATVLDLLEIITEQKIKNARHANPLTLLPGIVPVNHAIDRMLEEKTAFSLGYFDLDNFKPYNDLYGYDAGDSIIQLLAGFLGQVYASATSLVGHIGGDDFIVIDTSETYQENCATISRLFAENVPAYYRRENLEAGGIKGCDRMGHPTFFPLLSISIGIVPPETTQHCTSHIQISDLASEAKKLAKQSEGNSCFINRRSPES